MQSKLALICLLTSLCPIPVGTESKICKTGIRVKSHPQTVAMGYKDRRPLTTTEFTN